MGNRPTAPPCVRVCSLLYGFMVMTE